MNRKRPRHIFVRGARAEQLEFYGVYRQEAERLRYKAARFGPEYI